MAPGGTLFRFTPHFGENVLPHGSHEWLPYRVIPGFPKRLDKQQFTAFQPPTLFLPPRHDPAMK